MKIVKTDFKDLLLIKSNKFADSRGLFVETCNFKFLDDYLDNFKNFIQSNLVKSKKNVLRGLHFQTNPFEQAKLVSVLNGSILDIAVDLRKNSKTYGKYYSIKLDSNDTTSLYIPRGFAHGYLSLENDTLVNYFVDNVYQPKYELGIHFRNKKLKIDWNICDSKIIISEKDKLLDFEI